MAINDLVAQLYREQLGREADPEGAAYWASQLAGGASPEAVRQAFAQSLEGQNLLTQAITSAYRQNLARNPEQEGYQYWQSLALDQALSSEAIRNAIRDAAAREQTERNILGQTFTEMDLPGLEADPYGGRYATTNIFDLPQDAVNVSTIGNRRAQFVAPITQQQFISQFGADRSYSATPGQDVLSNPVVVATLQRSLNAGTLDQKGYEQIVKDLTTATDMEQVREAFNKPQARVIIDAIYGLQTGEDINAETARLEAADRQAVIDSLALNYYPSNMMLAQEYANAGLQYPFGPEAYQGYDTMMRERDVVTPDNFNRRINELLTTLNQQFGGTDSMQTPGLGQYYSETGLQPGFTPFGTEGTMFRSGVAGYVPQSQLPTRFEFGAPPVNATFQQYRPGAFQPEGVTTGGFITGYTQQGTPIYSTYADPNTNVGGQTSTLNPFNAAQQQQLADVYANYQAQLAAQQAAALQGSSGG